MNRRLLFFGMFLILVYPALAGEQRLTLRDTVRMAARKSLQVNLARIQSDDAAAKADEAKAVFLPRLAVGTGAAKTYGFPLSIEGSAPSIFEVDFSQSLYDRRQRKQADSVRLDHEGVLAEVAAAQQQAAVQAGLTYLELRAERSKRPYHQTALESLEQKREVVRVRVESGMAEPRKLTEAELALARARLDLASGEENALVLEDRLREALGLPAGSAIVLSDDAVPWNEADFTEETLVEDALGSDPALKRLRLQEQSHRTALEGLSRPFLPIVRLVGKYGVFSKFNNFDKYFNKFQRNNALFGVSVQVPVYTPEVAPEKRQLQAALAATEVRIRMRTLELRSKLRGRLAGLRTLQAREEVARLQLSLASQNLDVAEARFDQGEVMLTDLEDARREGNSLRIDYVDVKLAREESLFQLYSQSGRLLQDIQ